jgi:hypothetical protein
MARVAIKSLGVLSVAKMYAALMGIFGLIIGVIYGLFIIVFGVGLLSSGVRGTAGAGVGGIVGGLVAMIGIPLFYMVFGFVGGAITAFVYNIVAGMAGGVEMDIENIN